MFVDNDGVHRQWVLHEPSSDSSASQRTRFSFKRVQTLEEFTVPQQKHY
jgi:hypothetical protein